MPTHNLTIHAFSMTRLPALLFGPGVRSELPGRLAAAGHRRVALITGGQSLRQTQAWPQLLDALHGAGLKTIDFALATEPSPTFVDKTAMAMRIFGTHCVVAIGGGSVLDAGKAAAAAYHMETTVRDFLEGVGTRTPDGRTLPFYAMPTTAGTGSEATTNSVLSEIGPDGFKKSLRHPGFMPHEAILDPQLAVGCPPAVTAACGMDALTQLLEGYVSTAANPITDALAESGLRRVGRSLRRACQQGDDLDARGDMAYAACLSGVVLTHAGLGIVHGAASPAGALAPIGHGVFCANLLAGSVRHTLAAMQTDHPAHARARAKYARAALLLGAIDREDAQHGPAALVAWLEECTTTLAIPRLSQCHLTAQMLDTIAAATQGKCHPVQLDAMQVKTMLEERW